MWLSKVIPRRFRGLSFAENRPPAWPESHPATVACLHGRENTADFRGSLPRNLLTTQILRAHAETFTASTRSSLCHAARGGKNVHSAVRKIAALFLFRVAEWHQLIYFAKSFAVCSKSSIVDFYSLPASYPRLERDKKAQKLWTKKLQKWRKQSQITD
jgi:hypothetical protein